MEVLLLAGVAGLLLFLNQRRPGSAAGAAAPLPSGQAATIDPSFVQGLGVLDPTAIFNQAGVAAQALAGKVGSYRVFRVSSSGQQLLLTTSSLATATALANSQPTAYVQEAWSAAIVYRKGF